MNKIAKRIKKNLHKATNVLVFGGGWGILEDILSIYDTVFVVADTHPEIYKKNLVYRKSDDNLSALPKIGIIFFDRDQVSKLNKIMPLITSARPQIAIEGEEVIPRSQSGLLYQNHYVARGQFGFFHAWESL